MSDDGSFKAKKGDYIRQRSNGIVCKVGSGDRDSAVYTYPSSDWEKVVVTPAPEPLSAVRYINVYRHGDAITDGGFCFPTRELADETAFHNHQDTRVGVRRVVLVEGEWDG